MCWRYNSWNSLSKTKAMSNTMIHRPFPSDSHSFIYLSPVFHSHFTSIFTHLDPYWKSIVHENSKQRWRLQAIAQATGPSWRERVIGTWWSSGITNLSVWAPHPQYELFRLGIPEPKHVYNFAGQLLLGGGHAQIASMFEQSHFHTGSDLLNNCEQLSMGW